MIFIGVAVYLYTASFPVRVFFPVSTKTLHTQGYNPLEIIFEWSKIPVNLISGRLAGKDQLQVYGSLLLK